MWIGLIVGVVGGWVVLAALLALVLGRAVHVAERRGPRARSRRGARAVSGRSRSATGQIPVIGVRALKAVTGAIPTVRTRNS